MLPALRPMVRALVVPRVWEPFRAALAVAAGDGGGWGRIHTLRPPRLSAAEAFRKAYVAHRPFLAKLGILERCAARAAASGIVAERNVRRERRCSQWLLAKRPMLPC